MIDPSLTQVWHRRVGAALVDLGITVGALAALTALQVERFSPDEGGLFPPADFDRMAELSRTVNRYVEVAGTRYVLAGAELVMTLVVTALVALVVHVVLPGTTGTSPGKKVFGLKVVTIRGDVIDARQAAVRTAVGLLDLLPVVVPWAVGAVVARRSPLHQRLGDRAAGTAVVDARRPLLVAGEAGEAGESAAAPHVPQARTASGSDVSPATSPAAVAAESEPTSPAAEPVGGRPPVGGWAGRDPSSAVDGSGGARPAATPAPAPVTPVRDLHGDAAPAALFVERRRGRTGARGRAVPPPQHRRTPAAAAPGAPDARTAPDIPDEPDGRTALDATGAATTGDDGDWPRPRAEPAPVWDPATLADWLGRSTPPSGEPPQPPQPVNDHPRRRADDPPAAAAPPAADPTHAPAIGGPGDEPVWDEQWQAWLYFDRATGRWHRHDQAAGAWEPIS